MENKSIVVIGSGFSSLSAGIYAKANGYSTTILKQPRLFREKKWSNNDNTSLKRSASIKDGTKDLAHLQYPLFAALDIPKRILIVMVVESCLSSEIVFDILRNKILKGYCPSCNARIPGLF